MALMRQQSVFTFKSSSGGVDYYFDIVVDAQGLLSFRNIRSPQGVVDPGTNIPNSVIDDITTAKQLVQQLVGETQAASGTVTFTGETSQAVTIPAGTLNNTNYRVVCTTTDGTALTIENKTTVGFNIVAATAYGTVADPKTVGWVVLTKTQEASVTGGVLAFTPADAGQKSVVFSPAFTSNAYRVILSEVGFFKAFVVSQTKAGFTVGIGYTLEPGETVLVGYDVFVS
jgi:hypothetical protein